MKYNIRMSTTFKKDLKLAKRRGANIAELIFVTNELANGNVLEEKYRDHALHGNWEGYRECHIEPDWLLIYSVNECELILYLMRTGTHSDLFSK